MDSQRNKNTSSEPQDLNLFVKDMLDQMVLYYLCGCFDHVHCVPQKINTNTPLFWIAGIGIQPSRAFDHGKNE